MTYGLPDSFLYGSYKRIRGAFGRGRGRGRLGGSRSSIDFDIRFGGLTLFDEKLDLMLNSKNGEVGKHLNNISRIIVSKAKLQAGSETGKLRSSIRWDYRRTAVGQSRIIGAYVPYAYLHHEGSKPHTIVPKTNEVLSFKSKGVLVYAQEVDHPGVKPNRYLSDQLVVVSEYLNMLPRG
jgi:hypothetical protein